MFGQLLIIMALRYGPTKFTVIGFSFILVLLLFKVHSFLVEVLVDLL